MLTHLSPGRAAALALLLTALLPGAASGQAVLETRHVRVEIGADGALKGLTAKATGEQYAWTERPSPVAFVYRGGSSAVGAQEDFAENQAPAYRGGRSFPNTSAAMAHGRTAVPESDRPMWNCTTRFLCAIGTLVLCEGRLSAAEPIVRAGAGSYATSLPPGAKGPPETLYVTENWRGPVPTGDWWSSLVWMPFSERQYAHPLAFQAEPGGMRVFYPGARITANQVGIFGVMPGGGEDMILGHSAVERFPDARLDAASDWFVRASFASGKTRMLVGYGHGSPFVYATYEGGNPTVTFARSPEVWSGGDRSAVLGVTVGAKPYALFGPAGATWAGLGGKALMCQSHGKTYFSLALLPEKSEKALALFRRHAYAHVTDTRIAWRYEPKSSGVETTFTFTCHAHEGDEHGTLFALYPHQWRNTDHGLSGYSYQSVRGEMRLAEGTSFATRMTFPGVLPALPDAGACDKTTLHALLDAETRPDPRARDTYWKGKFLGRLAALVPVAEQAGNEDAARRLTDELRRRLEGWFSASSPDARPKRGGLFYYDKRWGTLIGYPASYASDVELNDHHFHYGYFIRAAAEVARRDPAWAGADRFGPMVELLVRDVASPGRADPMFPFLRCFDPYAGHSWASGTARFADGNNQESSSEAMNAWYGLVLWGEATGDTTLRDLGVFLYTTEMHAIEEYWFDVLGRNRPREYWPTVVTMVWGGKGVYETWFSAAPEAKHGINWLPIHAGSLYLGRYPEYVERSYQSLLGEKAGKPWDQWADLIWMVRALSDPQDAIRQYEARPKDFRFEAGNSPALTCHWLHNLARLGRVDRTVTADWPLYAVFRNGREKAYATYNVGRAPRTVTFSDGTQVRAAPGAVLVWSSEGPASPAQATPPERRQPDEP